MWENIRRILIALPFLTIWTILLLNINSYKFFSSESFGHCRFCQIIFFSIIIYSQISLLSTTHPSNRNSLLPNKAPNTPSFYCGQVTADDCHEDQHMPVFTQKKKKRGKSPRKCVTTGDRPKSRLPIGTVSFPLSLLFFFWMHSASCLFRYRRYSSLVRTNIWWHMPRGIVSLVWFNCVYLYCYVATIRIFFTNTLTPNSLYCKHVIRNFLNWQG